MKAILILLATTSILFAKPEDVFEFKPDRHDLKPTELFFKNQGIDIKEGSKVDIEFLKKPDVLEKSSEWKIKRISRDGITLFRIDKNSRKPVVFVPVSLVVSISIYFQGDLK